MFIFAALFILTLIGVVVWNFYTAQSEIRPEYRRHSKHLD